MKLVNEDTPPTPPSLGNAHSLDAVQVRASVAKVLEWQVWSRVVGKFGANG